MLRQREAGCVDQRERNDDEHRHLRQMQRENAEVETQQLRIESDLREGYRAILVVLGRRRLGNDVEDEQDRRQRQRARHAEEPAHADRLVEDRCQHQRQSENQADRGTDHRHHLGAVLLAGKVGGQRGDGGGNGARALQDAAGDDPVDIGCQCRDEAADGEDDEADDDHPLATEAVGGGAKGDLQHRLRQAVGADGDADQRQVVAAGDALRVHGKDGQDQEEAEHAQRKNGGEAGAGALFVARHRVGRRGKHGCWTRLVHAGEARILAGLLS